MYVAAVQQQGAVPCLSSQGNLVFSYQWLLNINDYNTMMFRSAVRYNLLCAAAALCLPIGLPAVAAALTCRFNYT